MTYQRKTDHFKSPAHIGIKENEEADKAAKQAIDMTGMTTTRLPHTDCYLTIRRARNSEQQKEWENNISKLHYIKLHIKEWESAHNCCRQYEVKLSRINIGHIRLNHGHLMSRNNQPIWKYSMWKPETNNKTLPTRQHLMVGQQKETQYPGYHKDTTRK